MRKILIVEDELVVRSIYRRKFEMSGYQVETAEDGFVALKLLPDFKPDIIQVDIMMPGMDGVEVIRQIRAWPDFRDVPILVLSSFYRPDLAKEAWKAGASKCVSKMDCTPNLALELIEQLLSGENTGFAPKFGTIPMPEGVLDAPPSPPKKPDPAGRKPAPSPALAEELYPWAEEHPASFMPKLKGDLNLPPSKGASPSRPAFAQEKEGLAPSPPAQPAELAILGTTESAAPKQPTRPTLPSTTIKSAQHDRFWEPDEPPTPPPPTKPQPVSALDVSASPSGPDFRTEIRHDFLKRVPQIQAEMRERVNAIIKNKSTTDQLRLLGDLEGSVSSLASLAGITGFSRISHLSGALDALIKDLRKNPSQMTSSVLRTIAHAMDCLNVLFCDINRLPQEIPPSILILAVDDEPISRRTISIALGKASLRCIALEDSRLALTILQENSFDLILLDAEMPGLNGFELCAELRKLPTNKTAPVIFVTSLTKFETRAQSSLAGGNDLIAKPFLMMELAVKALTYLLKPQLSIQAKTALDNPAEEKPAE